MKKIIVQRHGRYDSRWPKDWSNITKKEAKTLGHLTPEGIEETRAITIQRLQNLERIVPTTDFLLIHSPTYWLDNPYLGQRAKETADIIAEEIKTAGGNVVENRLDFRLGETLIFQTPFADFLRKQCEGQGPEFWKSFFTDRYRHVRQRLGAEGPEDIVQRINLVVKNSVEWLQVNNDTHPNKLVWIVSHGECTASYVIFAGALKVLWGKLPDDYNDGFEINYLNNCSSNLIANGNIIYQR